MPDPLSRSLPFNVAGLRLLGRFSTFVLSAAGVLALTLSVTLNEILPTARLSIVLTVLFLLHLMRYTKFQSGREIVLYAMLFLYFLVELFWTADLKLAANTLVPALNFLLVLVLFSSLVAYHDIDAVLAGMFSGFLAGASLYTGISGFPFVYPVGFSYNAIAIMYLFGLFLTLLFGWYKNSKVLIPIAALIVLAHVVATTSIKANLGILLGVAAAGVIYHRSLMGLARRNAFFLVVILGVIGFLVASSSTLPGGLERGLARINIGIEILQTREDVDGYGSFTDREKWQAYGLAGWARNPVFGQGVEAFRSEVGITSHSTPIDLLHNSGLIGATLFYAIFVSLAWRLLWGPKLGVGNVQLLILSTLTCFLFITLTGTVHYNSFLAAFIAISAGIFRRHSRRNLNAVTPSGISQT